jgi:hypothetical protein
MFHLLSGRDDGEDDSDLEDPTPVTAEIWTHWPRLHRLRPIPHRISPWKLLPALMTSRIHLGPPPEIRLDDHRQRSYPS